VTRTLRIFWLALGLIVSVPASSHELLTAALRLDESTGGTVLATLNTPLGKDGQPITVVPRFDPRCSLDGESGVRREPARIVREWHLRCAGGLTGTHLDFEGLDPRTPEALITVNFANGTSRILAVDRHDPSTLLSAVTHGNAAASLGAYLPLGIEHILLGPDHLLFVLGLMMVVSAGNGGMRQLVAALTAFTLAHSLTLGLAMFGIWGLPPKPVEILIALSIVLLAVELAEHARRQPLHLPPTLTLRKPWLVAFAFGLLHGFGFAGALSEIGLPEAARGWALLLFNLGVEIGQLLFVASVLLLMRIARQWPPLRKIQASPIVILLGSVAVYWTLDRTASWLQASNAILHLGA
jgi:hypothetical protein